MNTLEYSACRVFIQMETYQRASVGLIDEGEQSAHPGPGRKSQTYASPYIHQSHSLAEAALKGMVHPAPHSGSHTGLWTTRTECHSVDTLTAHAKRSSDNNSTKLL